MNRLPLIVAAGILASCGVVGAADGDGSIYIEYIGSPAGVYDAFCYPVDEEPLGRIVELATAEEKNIIDATYYFLPDGLRILDPGSPFQYADCREYDFQPAAPRPRPPPPRPPLPRPLRSRPRPPRLLHRPDPFMRRLPVSARGCASARDGLR